MIEFFIRDRLDEIMCRMRHPVEKEKIYIIGEAYSYEQGWVEGALNTAESTLEEFFDLPTPCWLKQKHNYLPVDCKKVCNDKVETKQPNACSKTLDEVTKFAYEGINHEYQ